MELLHSAFMSFTTLVFPAILFREDALTTLFLCEHHGEQIVEYLVVIVYCLVRSVLDILLCF